jgi:nicotinamidase-related amidase
VAPPSRNADLHGNVPDTCPVALLLVDVINDLEFEGGDALLTHALPMAERLAALARRCREARVPVVYVNDNFGRWRSDFRTLLQRCLDTPVRGRPVVGLLRPDDGDYFVLKPKHSGFYSTTLDLLLRYLGATTVILTGLTGDTCVLLTAHDAYMRDLQLVVPADCVASVDPAENEHALRYMARVLKADTRGSSELELPAFPHGAQRPAARDALRSPARPI